MSRHETLDPRDSRGWQELRQLGASMLTDVFEHLRTLREQPAWRPMPTEVQRQIQEQPLPERGQPLEAIYQEFKRNILPYGGGNLHPRFWGWVMGNGTPAGVLAEMLSAGLNANSWGGSHAALEIESLVISWCRQLMGFPETASGLLTSGCSLANLIGLAAARGRLQSGRVGVHGLRGLQSTPVAYVSTETHNSVEKAVDLLGIGRDNLRKVPVDDAFRMDPAALLEQIERDIADGFLPMAVVATVGTVATGAIDPLREIAAVCREHGVWLHIDGAFGALAILDPQRKSLLEGLELADSLAFDFHKWLSVPYEAACILVKNPEDHARTFASKTPYLSSTQGGPGAGSTWFCDLGPELSRGFRALKVWMTLREHGTQKFGRLIRQNINQAQLLASKIAKHQELELLAPVSLNLVCFRYRGDTSTSESELRQINQQALLELQQSGVAVPSHTQLHGKFAIRAAFVNHRTRDEDVELMLSAFLQACRRQQNKHHAA